jgi:hypothetical protein
VELAAVVLVEHLLVKMEKTDLPTLDLVVAVETAAAVIVVVVVLELL